MMREILDDQHAIGFALDFHAAANALKGSKSIFDRLTFDAATVSERDRCERIKNVMPARNGHSDASDFPAVVDDAKFRG